jgi:hypothetical protein
MRTVAIDDFDSGMESDVFAKYLKNRLLSTTLRPSVLGLKAYHEDCVPRIAGSCAR